jgi:chromosome segregation ATPase
MHVNKKMFGCLMAFVMLSGCATAPGSCDATNRDVSMITKMNCDYSGGYSEQVRSKEQSLTDARAENAMFRQVYENIAAQQAASRKDLIGQQKAQATLNQSLGQLLATLKTRHANKAGVQAQVSNLQAQLQSAQNTQNSGNSAAQLAAKQEELKNLQKKVSKLQLSLGYDE